LLWLVRLAAVQSNASTGVANITRIGNKNNIFGD